MIALAILALLITYSQASQTYPGTSNRPILSATEATICTKASYLQGWTPETVSTTTADYTVGSGGYSSIQAAVNAAIQAGGTTRKYIKILPGTYKQVVYIPKTTVPLTIYGNQGSNTVISLSLSATLTGAAYQALVGNLFASGDPAYSIYSSCASRTTVGTTCSSVFWVQSSDVEIINLTIENSSKNSGTDQAVALNINADKVQVNNCKLLGHQDTLFIGAGTSTVQRSYVTNTYIAGDVDFVFGDASTVFESCIFYVRDDRRNNSGVVFAPSTSPLHSYGYLAIDSTITGDSSWFTSQKVHLARAWDQGLTSASEYIAGTSPNGQLCITSTKIDAIIPSAAPYTTATSGRAYAGNANVNRNLNDNNLNRFWEYANFGNGA